MEPEECEHGVPTKHTCYKCSEHSISASFLNELLYYPAIEVCRINDDGSFFYN